MQFSKEQIDNLKLKAESLKPQLTEWVRVVDSSGEMCIGNLQGEVRRLTGCAGLPQNAMIFHEDGSIYIKT